MENVTLIDDLFVYEIYNGPVSFLTGVREEEAFIKSSCCIGSRNDLNKTPMTLLLIHNIVGLIDNILSLQMWSAVRTIL